MTSVAAWLSLPPAVYVIGRVLVPYGETDDEVIKHNDDILHLLQREQLEREGKPSLFGMVGKKLSSLFSVDLQLEAIFSWWLVFVSKSLNENNFDRAGQKKKVNGNDYGYEISRYVSEWEIIQMSTLPSYSVLCKIVRQELLLNLQHA